MSGPLTLDVITDRVRSICASEPFGYVEAESWETFDLQPTTNIDQVFRIPPPHSQHTYGMFNFAENRTDSMQIWLARKRNDQPDTVRRTLLRDMHSLTAAVMRDAYQVSGDYAIPDGGRGHTVVAEAGREYVVLRLTLPINYEAQL